MGGWIVWGKEEGKGRGVEYRETICVWRKGGKSPLWRNTLPEEGEKEGKRKGAREGITVLGQFTWRKKGNQDVRRRRRRRRRRGGG